MNTQILEDAKEAGFVVENVSIRLYFYENAITNEDISSKLNKFVELTKARTIAELAAKQPVEVMGAYEKEASEYALKGKPLAYQQGFEKGFKEACRTQLKTNSNEAVDAERLKFLHSTNIDKNGYEYGVAKVRFANGQLSNFEWTLSDHSDVDAAMKEEK